MTNVPVFLHAAQVFLLMALILLSCEKLYPAGYLLLFAAFAFAPVAAQDLDVWERNAFALLSMATCTALAVQSLILSTSPIISTQTET